MCAFNAVSTYNRSAFFAVPAVFLVCKEVLQSAIPDLLQVLDHAHAVFASVAFVQTLDPGTWKEFTFIAEF